MPKRVDVEVRTDRSRYLPGEDVELTVSAAVKHDVEVAEAWAELVWENEYTYDFDDPEGGSKITKTEVVLAAEELFLERERLRRGDTVDRTFTLRLPSSAPPSAAGEIVAVRWYAQARFVVQRDLDARGRSRIDVFQPRERFDQRAKAQPEAIAPGCAVDVEVPEREVRPGDVVLGSLVLLPESDLKVREVRVELVQEEEAWEHADRPRRETATRAQAVCDRKTRLRGGARHSYDFELRVPDDAAPCLATKHGVIGWVVRGVVDRRLRFDAEAKLPLNVYTAPTSPAEVTEWREAGRRRPLG